ncbi:MAG: hypothetical protein U9R74_06180 [Pseudomonadota bacterium]|nr:hypothetical protein [Pseudomonadota bacterium]
MKPSPESDGDLMAHMLDGITRIQEYTHGDRTVFFGSRLVQDAVIRNLQTLAESSQRLSDDLKAAEPGIDNSNRRCDARALLPGRATIETTPHEREPDLHHRQGRALRRLPENDIPDCAGLSFVFKAR